MHCGCAAFACRPRALPKQCDIPLAVEGEFDAVVIGSGPNGLAAAVALAQSGASTLLIEGADELGGGTRTAELTLPGFRHDVCSAVHTMGILSPYFRTLPLAEHGLEWVKPAASVAHPLDDGPAVMLWRDLERTSEGLGVDAGAYRSMIRPLLRDPHAFFRDALGPLGIPRSPLPFTWFGVHALGPSTWLAHARFRGERARALFAGCAGHSVLPLDKLFTSALGLMFLLAGHVEEWPVARGGSEAIHEALASLFRSLGGEVRTGARIQAASDLPAARVYVFDTSPDQLASICEPTLPARYVRRLRRYRFGPGVFKLDWALDGPIPWSDPACLEASTLHVGGTMDEIAASEADMMRGRHSDRPYLIVCQQSQFDDSRAPAGQHTGYAYCHVPEGSTVDRTDAIESQIERFAPGFRDRILERRAMRTDDFAAYNPNFVGGAITGGMADLPQLFTRPVARLNPYTTPNPRVLICSASTPPGGGVHGMGGYHAAQTAIRRLEGLPKTRLV